MMQELRDYSAVIGGIDSVFVFQEGKGPRGTYTEQTPLTKVSCVRVYTSLRPEHGGAITPFAIF